MIKRIILLLAVAYGVNAQPVYVGGKGGVVATNVPGDDSTPMYLRAFTNSEGTIIHYYSQVVAANTNSQPPTATLTNLSATGAITNLNSGQFNVNSFIAVIKSGALLTNIAHHGIFTNHGTALFIGSISNASYVDFGGTITNHSTFRQKGNITVESDILVLTSNRTALASFTEPASNIWASKISLVGNGPYAAPPAGSILLVRTNNKAFALKSDGTLVDLEEQGAGSVSSGDASQFNLNGGVLVIKSGAAVTNLNVFGDANRIIGVTNTSHFYFMGEIIRDVETVSGTIIDFGSNKAPVKFLTLSGNTTVTLSNLNVGGGGILIVSNPASHTFSIAGAALYDNQNTTPPVTTNGYTVYDITRFHTSLTNISVRGRELELVAGPNNSLNTNATGTQINLVGMVTVSSNNTVIGIQTNLNFIYGSNVVVVATNNTSAGRIDIHISAIDLAGGGTVTGGNANQFTLDGGVLSIKNGVLVTNVLNHGWLDVRGGITNTWYTGTGAITNSGAIQALSTVTIHGQTTLTNILNGGWTDNILGVTNRAWVSTVGNTTNSGAAQLLSTVVIHGATTLTNVLNGGWSDIRGGATNTWMRITGNITNTADFYGQTVNMLAGVVTNNITYLTADINPSGNATNFQADYTFGWRTCLMTNNVHVTGVVNVAAANLGKPWMLKGRNTSGSTFKASVATTMRRSGTNFVNVANNQNFDIVITPDGTGGVNETNQTAQIIVYDSP